MNPRCHDITHPPLKGGVTVTNSSLELDQAHLAAAITTVAAMTDDEFYTACEAIGITAQGHNAYCANQRQEQHQ